MPLAIILFEIKPSQVLLFGLFDIIVTRIAFASRSVEKVLNIKYKVKTTAKFSAESI